MRKMDDRKIDETNLVQASQIAALMFPPPVPMLFRNSPGGRLTSAQDAVRSTNPGFCLIFYHGEHNGSWLSNCCRYINMSGGKGRQALRSRVAILLSQANPLLCEQVKQ
jgi:hypothetical protein